MAVTNTTLDASFARLQKAKERRSVPSILNRGVGGRARDLMIVVRTNQYAEAYARSTEEQIA